MFLSGRRFASLLSVAAFQQLLLREGSAADCWLQRWNLSNYAALVVSLSAAQGLGVVVNPHFASLFVCVIFYHHLVAMERHM